MKYTLIANSGIQQFTFRLKINKRDRFKEWFHEWYDTNSGEWKLELIYKLSTEDGDYYYSRTELLKKGYLSSSGHCFDVDDLKKDGIMPLRIDDEMIPGVKGVIFNLSFSDKDSKLKCFENKWIPAPYFFKRTANKFKFGPLNWVRFKLVPVKENNDTKEYDVLLAFDTRTTYEVEHNNENPVFPDRFRTEIDLALCDNDLYLVDYCASGEKWSYIDEYIMHLVHPEISRISQLRGADVRKMEYIASYIFLISYLAKNRLFPAVKLYKDVDVETKDVDMVIDIGNSRTTALLIEDNSSFNQVRPLRLIDFTNSLDASENGLKIRSYTDPFDMRLAFRKVNFGKIGPKDSSQFVYPSLVRLGNEAKTLIHSATILEDRLESLSTYSSPKRYLWDWRPNKEEWQYLVLPGEDDDHILYLPGITNQIKSDGKVDAKGESGGSFHYSRRSLMTLSFLEMLAQAQIQINSVEHRSKDLGFGYPERPRKIKRIIVTCPTAMSRLEREALVGCAKDAVSIMSGFLGGDGMKIEVIPSVGKDNDGWYYDEATCSQLVYMYGEAGYKYKGCCGEFFNLYGKREVGESQSTLTVGSLDIGAGTTDLMISRYSYDKGDITTITPEPLFYDSYYFAGDDMLNGLIKNVMLLNEESAFRRELKDLPSALYRQKIKNFFGQDYNGQTLADRILRKDFNIQYSVPLMCHFLELVKRGENNCVVRYDDVFGECGPSSSVISGFKERTGIDVTRLEWSFNNEKVSAVIKKEFEPLLKRIATIMFNKDCDIILLSGRPSSLPVIKDIFLESYVISPDKLIMLNNYYVGDWYPFDNNTGHISNSKTIVAMGGVIGHYATGLPNLDKFVINLDRLRVGLKSTINYIEASRDRQPIEYFITPERDQGELTISRLPAYLNTRHIDMDTYPSRNLYTIDFNTYKIADRILKRAINETGESIHDSKLQALVREQVDALRKKMPFKLTIARDHEDIEKLSIVSIYDRDGNELTDSNVEIHIQSLGVDEKYWLDSGAFNF